MNILITLTTFLLIIITQLLMLQAQEFKEKKTERQKTLSDAVKMSEYLTTRKRDADRITKRALYDINGDGSIDYALGSQGIGTRRRTDDVNAESTPRRFNVGMSSNLLGNTGRGNLAFDYTSPDYLRYLGNLRGDYNGNSEYQRALYIANLLRNRGVENDPHNVGDVVNNLGKYISRFTGTMVGGLHSALDHASDTVGELLGRNREGGFLGSKYIIDGASKTIGNGVDILARGVHNIFDDASHLTHDIFNPDEYGNLGGSFGFQRSAGGRINSGLLGSAGGRINPAFLGSAGGLINSGFQGSADDGFSSGLQGNAGGGFISGLQRSAGGGFSSGLQGSAGGGFSSGLQRSAGSGFSSGLQGSAGGGFSSGLQRSAGDGFSSGLQRSAGGGFSSGLQGSAGGGFSSGLQGSADGRFNPALQYYLSQNGYYN